MSTACFGVLVSAAESGDMGFLAVQGRVHPKLENRKPSTPTNRADSKP